MCVNHDLCEPQYNDVVGLGTNDHRSGHLHLPLLCEEQIIVHDEEGLLLSTVTTVFVFLLHQDQSFLCSPRRPLGAFLARFRDSQRVGPARRGHFAARCSLR